MHNSLLLSVSSYTMNQPVSDDTNKRTVQAVVLCVIVAMTYSQIFLSPPPPPPPAPNPTTVVDESSAVTVKPLPASQVTQSHPTKEQLASAQLITVENKVAKVDITSLGGRISSFKLLDYKRHVGEADALDMVASPDGAVLPLAAYVDGKSDDLVAYHLIDAGGESVSSPSFQVLQDKDLALTFQGSFANGQTITKRFHFKPDTFLFSVDIELTDASGAPIKAPISLEWAHYFPKNEENPRVKITHLTYLNAEEKIKHVALDEVGQKLVDFGPSKWVSLGDLYFMSTVIPVNGSDSAVFGQEGEVLLGRIKGNAESSTFNVYVGPKDYKTLTDFNLKLEKAIDLGWFAFVAKPLLWAIHYLYLVFSNYGVAIIVLTLCVRSIMLPLSKASFESAKKMQDLQPEIKALKERVKDPQQQNKEVFELYKRRGVNPMGGCLPLLIQIPVFFGLYQALLNSIELRHAPYALWIKDLSSPEYLHIYGVGIPVMVLLMASSMIIQQRTMPQPADPAQAKAMAFMPFVIAGTFIFFPMPAGLVLYWLVSNIISITQQIYLRNTDKGNVYVATALVGLLTFCFGYFITFI